MEKKTYEINGEMWEEGYITRCDNNLDPLELCLVQGQFNGVRPFDGVKLLVKVKEKQKHLTKEPMPECRPGDVVRMEDIESIGYMLTRQWRMGCWEVIRLGEADCLSAFKETTGSEECFTHIYRDGKLLWERKD